jgi:protein-tyrosine phosphatase
MERTLGLVGAPNARDLGGLPTADGRRVRTGVLYRSSALGRLADQDVAALGRLRLSCVVDLRDSSEIQVAPADRLPTGPGQAVRHIPLFDPQHPVFTYLSAVLLGHRGTGYEGLRAQGTPAAMLHVYRWFVADAGARATIAAAVRVILAAGGAPVLFHCSAGKDRTGWLSAVLLETVGVPRDVVVEDYLSTNDYARSGTTAVMNAMRARGMAVDPAELLPVFEAREEYLAAAYGEVAERFGDLAGYVRDGLGLTGEELDTLRRLLVYQE